LFEKAGKAVLEVLASDPLAVSMRLQVAASLFPAEFGDLVNSLDAAGALQADAVDAADRQLRQGGVVVTALPEIEARLADSGSAQLRRLAFAALAGQANDRQGWTEDRKARLMRFRNDPDPMVAAAAQWTFVDATDDGLPE
jgi:hypothetical protein